MVRLRCGELCGYRYQISFLLWNLITRNKKLRWSISLVRLEGDNLKPDICGSDQNIEESEYIKIQHFSLWKKKWRVVNNLQFLRLYLCFYLLEIDSQEADSISQLLILTFLPHLLLVRALILAFPSIWRNPSSTGATSALFTIFSCNFYLLYFDITFTAIIWINIIVSALT